MTPRSLHGTARIDARAVPPEGGGRVSTGSHLLTSQNAGKVMPDASTQRRRFSLPVGLILVLPTLLFLAVFMVYPVANLIYLSFHDYSPLRSAGVTWVGVDNYATAATEPATLESLWTTVIFTVGSVAIELVLGLLVATLLARVTLEYGGRIGQVLSRAFAAGFILPFAVPGVAAAVVWKMFLDPQIGPLDAVIGSPIAWFAHYPMTAVIIIDAWKTMPFAMFLLYAAIMSIEPLQFEAAKLDGANPWQEFWHLTLPGILPVIAVTAAFRAVDAFTKAFDIILATTAGGPGQSTMVFPLYIWRTAFISLRFGEASALAVIAIIISGIIGASLLAMNRRAYR
jgi:ABC-type sugar transport system permease subunit